MFDELTRGPGWASLSSSIPSSWARDLDQIPLDPRRGKTASGTYWDGQGEAPELALWWSQQVSSDSTVSLITNYCLGQVTARFNLPVIYSADVIVNTTLNRERVYPHQDTPYRFPKWHRERGLLAVQFLVPITEFTYLNGATGVVDDSYRYHWNTDDLYSAAFDRWFQMNQHQIQMGPGDILAYNPRILHSTMPNRSDRDRKALLISVMEQALAQELKSVDNIWT